MSTADPDACSDSDDEDTEEADFSAAAPPPPSNSPAIRSTNRGVHGSKLSALLANAKLPQADRPRVEAAVIRYREWVAAMDGLRSTGDALLGDLVALVNEYKRYIDIDLIYDSEQDFLYRQSGQLKVVNSILEEFMPRLADTRLVPGLTRIPTYRVGSQKAFAAFTFSGTVHTLLGEGGILIKGKNQDYAVSKPVYLTASTSQDYSEDAYTTIVHVAYVAAECKTNLDKTMFNEGMETARALKQAVAGARYLLVCEWLDMPPISTSLTDIDDAIILRKAKRLSSNFRSTLATSAGRVAKREAFVANYDGRPMAIDCFARIVAHLNTAFPEQTVLDETEVLNRGYF